MNRKGAVAELAVAKAAAALGFGVYLPVIEHGRADLVFEVGGVLLRVQCKAATRNGDTLTINARGSWHSPTRGYVRSTYSVDDVDLIVAYCDTSDECYAVPIDEFEGQGQFVLRFAPAANGQRAALHFACDYSLGAVAQLAERFAGSEEARGSNPLSSIPPHASRSTPETVGAHEFRNHFGWYIQRARAGETFQVTRRGRPLARVGPPADQLEMPRGENSHGSALDRA